MNYYIEKHDMEIILDSLEFMVETMKTREMFGLPSIWPYSKEDVDVLCKSLDTNLVGDANV